jgi:hypothetical protein
MLADPTNAAMARVLPIISRARVIGVIEDRVQIVALSGFADAAANAMLTGIVGKKMDRREAGPL